MIKWGGSSLPILQFWTLPQIRADAFPIFTTLNFKIPNVKNAQTVILIFKIQLLLILLRPPHVAFIKGIGQQPVQIFSESSLSINNSVEICKLKFVQLHMNDHVAHLMT